MAASEIIARARAAFPNAAPRLTLREGNDLDSNRTPVRAPEDNRCAPDDGYLEAFCWGVAFLDSESWRFYLPHLISYAIRHEGDGGSLVVLAFLESLRPPDRVPPRLATVTEEEREVIVAVLEHLGLSARSAYQEAALQVLEEYWIPGSTYGQ